MEICGWQSTIDATWTSTSGLVVEYIVAIDVTRVRFPADAFLYLRGKTAEVLINRWTCQLDSWCEGQHCGF